MNIKEKSSSFGNLALSFFDENQINLNEVAEAFSITESYLFRRTICDLPTNALNKIFLLLNREIMRYDGTDSNYIEKLYFQKNVFYYYFLLLE